MPPPGWQPPPGWKPDPSWPEPPDGWQLWVEEPPPRSVPSKRTWGLIGAATTLVGLLVIAFGPWFHPDFNDPNKVSSDEQRAEYDATVNAMCQDVLDDLVKIDLDAIDDPAHARDTSRRVSDMYARLRQRWSALEPPVPGDEPAIRSMLSALERISRAFADMSIAFTLSSPALVWQTFAQASEAEDQAGADFRSAAGRYGGVDTCVRLGR